MTQWGMLLLCVYVALGLSRASWRKAGRMALIITVLVLAAVVMSYRSSIPAPVCSVTIAPGQSASSAVGGSGSSIGGESKSCTASGQAPNAAPNAESPAAASGEDTSGQGVVGFSGPTGTGG